MTTSKSGKSKTLKGVVISDKMDKTVVVKVEEYKKHPRYNHFYRSSKKYKAHDEEGKFHTDDKVIIKEVKPISKDKHFVVIKKL
ncbi:MAG: 30S ribosomal protein S17 [Candidatus Azambacteria bacterium]|nr:30S ribosomal protein S17 [Candidatus Azambacteria bacterium]